ncbi:MAG: SpaA isopeptide-forming pilin-related protein [Lachnospiraceae bacterium]
MSNSAVGVYQVGGFTGYKDGAGSIINCYSTGTVSVPASSTWTGGFIGYYVAGTITNNYFDKTTTRLTAATGGGSSSGITGLTTKQMILMNSYSSWGMVDNFLGAANPKGTNASPWYIDDDMTYPYLYYQYDGHSETETNYNLGGTFYQDNTSLGQRRADFSVTKSNLPLKVISAGAVKAYMPYLGVSRYDISSTAYTNVPGAAYNTGLLYSLGSISSTNIIAFASVPTIQKSSNRTTWNVDDETTYTWVGDTITYTLVVSNLSTEADFTDVVITDNINTNLELLEDSITINPGTAYNADTAETLTTETAAKPYYSTASGKLYLYLNDMPKVSSTTGDITSYTITYKVYVNKEAASSFTTATTYTGDIENTGTLAGNLVYPDTPLTPVPFQTSFTDGNEDPVYDVCLFEFTKTDLSGEQVLEDAEFSAYYWTGVSAPSGLVDSTNITTDISVANKWYLCDSQVSDDEGIVTMRLGKYPTSYAGYFQLVEEQAPLGYTTPTGQWLLHVNSIAYVDSISTIQSTGSTESFTTTTKAVTVSEISYTVIDTAALANKSVAGSVTIKKYGESNEPVAGAEFTIERYNTANSTWVYILYDDTEDAWEDWVSGEYYTQTTVTAGGVASTVFAGLPIGKYRFTEVAAPEGYELLKAPFEGVIPTIGQDDVPVYDITFEVRDNLALQLPAAGGTGSIMRVLPALGGGLLFVGIAGVLWRRKRKKYIF